MTHHCDLADDHIVLYALDDLRGARREYVEAHINACSECQRRLAEFRGITRLLQQSGTVADDVGHRATLRTRIASNQSDSPYTPGRSGHKRKLFRWQPMLLAGLLLVLAVVFLAPEASRASFPLGRVIGILTESASDGPSALSSNQERPATPEPLRHGVAELPFQPVAPFDLPLGLELVDQQWPQPHVVASRYDNTISLSVELIQTPIAVSDLAISPTIETVMILDTIVMQHTSPEPGAIAALYWVRDGFVFQLLPLRTSQGGLMAEDAHQIAKSLMYVQDEMTRNVQGLGREE